MNLVNPGRSILQKVPGLNSALDKILARITALWSAEHNPDGTHSIITERGRTVAQGVWIDVQYDPTNFSTQAGTATWTVAKADQAVYRYTLVGETMFLCVRILSSSIGAGSPPGELRIKVPGGFVMKSTTSGAAIVVDSGTSYEGEWYAENLKTYVSFARSFSTSSWTAGGTDNNHISALCVLNVEPV